MRALSNSDFLQLWERGSRLHPLDQALLALGAALPEMPHEDLADWPLGRRNTALAELRRSCFGGTLQGWVLCPQCGERLEFEMDSKGLVSQALDRDQAERIASEQITVNGRRFRLPTSRDLARLAGEIDPHAAALRLVESCRIDGAETPGWSERDLDEVGEQLALADPMAETRLALECAECGNRWDEPLDIASYLWTEIEACARRLVTEVHTLASAYCWTEEKILSMSELRRALYLEMVRA
jgi:hypothetical protein